MVGVAGSGKTTVMGVAADAYAAAGYEVVGTATSGQAARTLGQGAGLTESRTLRSLLWRLDHDRLQLHGRSVVILDEVGMTEDAGLLRLLVAVELAKSKVILVGDDRQLSAVGPGGAPGALLERHGGAVHVLDENLRQRDPGERAVLAELRAGNAERAVEWYVGEQRIVAAPDRDDVLDAMVEAWAVDRAAGHDTALFAWRRVNVDELNRRARTLVGAAGQLTGPELEAPGGRRYATGDRIVTLAPGSDGTLVTSERGTVDPGVGVLTARMDDDRAHVFALEETAADRLAHGYAVTVHRSQGATVDRSHVLHDGGGRELAYVAMSRSRGPSMAYVVADDQEQAIEDLARDWSNERRQRWTIDTGTPAEPAAAPSRAEKRIDAALRDGQLKAERDAVAGAIPANPTQSLVRARQDLDQLRQARENLGTGGGQYEGTDVGSAARSLSEAKRQRRQAEHLAYDPATPWIAKRQWRRTARSWTAREARANATFTEKAGPELDCLGRELPQDQGQSASEHLARHAEPRPHGREL